MLSIGCTCHAVRRQRNRRRRLQEGRSEPVPLRQMHTGENGLNPKPFWQQPGARSVRGTLASRCLNPASSRFLPKTRGKESGEQAHLSWLPFRATAAARDSRSRMPFGPSRCLTHPSACACWAAFSFCRQQNHATAVRVGEWVLECRRGHRRLHAPSGPSTPPNLRVHQ